MRSVVRVGLVCFAGALGALARYGVSLAVGARSFPWSTLAINVVGSFLLGLVLGADRLAPDLRLAVTVGFLGAFTPFSTFAFEATDLIRNGRAPTALAYVAASVVIGLVAAATGYAVGRPS